MVYSDGTSVGNVILGVLVGSLEVAGLGLAPRPSPMRDKVLPSRII